MSIIHFMHTEKKHLHAINMLTASKYDTCIILLCVTTTITIPTNHRQKQNEYEKTARKIERKKIIHFK